MKPGRSEADEESPVVTLRAIAIGAATTAATFFAYLPWQVGVPTSPEVIHSFWFGLPEGMALPWDAWAGVNAPSSVHATKKTPPTKEPIL